MQGSKREEKAKIIEDATRQTKDNDKTRHKDTRQNRLRARRNKRHKKTTTESMAGEGHAAFCKVASSSTRRDKTV
jgi:hypothetical protein